MINLTSNEIGAKFYINMLRITGVFRAGHFVIQPTHKLCVYFEMCRNDEPNKRPKIFNLLNYDQSVLHYYVLHMFSNRYHNLFTVKYTIYRLSHIEWNRRKHVTY